MKILIVKTSSLGDIIHVFPAVAFLRKKYPFAQIDWVVEKQFSDLLKGHPEITRVLKIDSKEWRKGKGLSAFLAFRKLLRQLVYDVVYDFQGNTKSGVVTSLARSPTKVGLGWRSAAEWLNPLFTHFHSNPPSGQTIYEDNLFLVQDYEKDFRQMSEFYSGVKFRLSPEEELRYHALVEELELNEKRVHIMVCPGSRWENKQLGLESLKDFLRRLENELKAHFIFVWGTVAEKKQVEELRQNSFPSSLLLEKVSLPLLQNLMSHMSLVVAMDSLPLHLAATAQVPTFSVFGASSAAKYQPRGPQHKALQGECPYGKTFEKRCPILRSCPTGACIKNFSGEELFSQFIPWWQTL